MSRESDFLVNKDLNESRSPQTDWLHRFLGSASEHCSLSAADCPDVVSYLMKLDSARGW